MDAELYDIIEMLENGGVGESIISTILSVLAVVLAVVFLVGIVFYILRAVALYNLGKNRGVRLYGLAWVPIANNWVLGGIADAHDKYDNRDYKWRHILLWLAVGIAAIGVLMGTSLSRSVEGVVASAYSSGDMTASLLSGIGGAGSLSSVFLAAVTAYSVCSYIAYFKLFESTSPTSCIILLIIGIVIPIAQPIILMCVRHKNADVGFEPTQPAIPAPQWQTDMQ